MSPRRQMEAPAPDWQQAALEWTPSKGVALETFAAQAGQVDAAAAFPDADVGSTVPLTARRLVHRGRAVVKESHAEHLTRVALAEADVKTTEALLEGQTRVADAARSDAGRMEERLSQLQEQLPMELAHRADEGWITPGAVASVTLNLLMIMGETSLTKSVFEILGASTLATWGIALSTQAMMVAGSHYLGALAAAEGRKEQVGERANSRRWLWLGSAAMMLSSAFLAAVRAGRLDVDQQVLADVVAQVQSIHWALGFGMFFAVQLGFLTVAALTGYLRHGPELSPLKLQRARCAKADAIAKQETIRMDALRAQLVGDQAKLGRVQERLTVLDEAELHRAEASVGAYLSSLVSASDAATAAAISAQEWPSVGPLRG